MNGSSVSAAFLLAQQELVAEFSQQRESLWQAVYFRLDHRLSGRVDPDDVLQEAWFEANQRLRQFVEQRDSWTMVVWIRVIVRQTLVNVHRRHFFAKKRDVSKEAGQGRDPSMPTIVEGCAGRTSTPSQVVMRKESFSQLQQALELMRPNDRDVLKLRHFEGLSNRETAIRLGVSEKAASIRYVRALERMKKIMDSDSPHELVHKT